MAKEEINKNENSIKEDSNNQNNIPVGPKDQPQ